VHMGYWSRVYGGVGSGVLRVGMRLGAIVGFLG